MGKPLVRHHQPARFAPARRVGMREVWLQIATLSAKGNAQP
jgi:hypothetical protein